MASLSPERVNKPQEQMDAAFDNYFFLSPVLVGDLDALLHIEDESQHWRRNFIRASVALVEGYAHCLREMCAVSSECVAPRLAKKERDVLLSPNELVASDRIRLTLRAAYKIFEPVPMPDFAGEEWVGAQHIFRKRNALMHPTTPSDLAVTDDLWDERREDVSWLLKQVMDFFALLHEKHDVDEK